jgi:thiol-disulfide isomerase/thioredoxin
VEIKMNKVNEKIAIVANIGMVLFTIIGSASFIKYYWLDSRKASPVIAAPAPEPVSVIGKKIALADVDWSTNDRTLFFVLSSECGFCRQSLPFYQQIVQKARSAGNVKLMAGFPQSVEIARRYLNSGKVEIDTIKQISPPSLGIDAFPSLLLIDKAGTVQKMWVGKLSENEEKEVFKQIGL